MYIKLDTAWQGRLYRCQFLNSLDDFTTHSIVHDMGASELYVEFLSIITFFPFQMYQRLTTLLRVGKESLNGATYNLLIN